MADIILRDLRARRGIHIGHRTVAEGEVLTRMQFRSEDDAKFFSSQLRWSAFDMVAASESPAPAAEKPASKGGKKKSEPSESPAPAVV